jgi:predicted lipid-binding transport protein (Tim44 family)
VSRSRKRHPIRGLFGGLLVGLGVALLLVLYGKIAFGTLTPYVIILAGVVVGVAWAFVAPVRGRRDGGDDLVEPPPPPAPEAPVTETVDTPESELESTPASAEAPVAPPFTATHIVPAGGLATYAGAEEGGGENGRLDPGLEVQVLEQHGDWAKILCSNGWSAWVDARQLQAR